MRYAGVLFLVQVCLLCGPSHAAQKRFCRSLAAITSAAAEDFRGIAKWAPDASGKDVIMETTVELPDASYPHVLRTGTRAGGTTFPAGMVLYKSWMYRSSDELGDRITEDYRRVTADVGSITQLAHSLSTLRGWVTLPHARLATGLVANL